MTDYQDRGLQIDQPAYTRSVYDRAPVSDVTQRQRLRSSTYGDRPLCSTCRNK